MVPRGSVFATWGAESLRAIQRDLYNPDRKVYFESGKTPDVPLDLRAEAELILAFSAAATYEPKFLPDLEAAIASASAYGNANSPTPGFGNLPGFAGGRSYTDNAKLALALLEAARVAKSAKASELAEMALTFALAGVDPKNGGVADQEGNTLPLTRKSANATSSVALAILRQADVSTPKDALGLYEWVRANLRDPSTNLFSPIPTLAGTDQKTPEAGDAAQMIEVACLLSQSTGDLKYAEQARRLEVLSLAQWFQQDGELSTDTLGGSALVDAWFDRIRLCPRQGEKYGAMMEAYLALQRLHDAGRDRDGHYGRKFGISPTAAEGWRVLDQAAAARGFFAAAQALRPGKK